MGTCKGAVAYVSVTPSLNTAPTRTHTAPLSSGSGASRLTVTAPPQSLRLQARPHARIYGHSPQGNTGFCCYSRRFLWAG